MHGVHVHVHCTYGPGTYMYNIINFYECLNVPLILWSFQLILCSVRQGGGNTVLLRWQDHISTLHLFAWLMLGAMCHNAIDVVAVEMRMEGSVSGRCQLFGSLSTHQDEVIKGIIRLLLGALENVATDREVVSTLA